MTHRIAIGQVGMHWTTRENMASIAQALRLAQAQGAALCAFSELAITGFHRQIAREAVPEIVAPAVDELRRDCARLGVGAAVGAPTFAEGGARFISHLLVDERGDIAATVSKQGLTGPEATFFQRGSSRPVGRVQGLRCSAVICREVEDLEQVSQDLPHGSVDLVFVPGALRQDPDKPRTDPPEYVRRIQRLARATGAYVVQTNWPNALNRPEDSVDGGESTVASPEGEVLFRLPRQASGVAVFTLGESRFDWHPQ
ncbi:carbon-nitrogen hydrolase family protein [Ramlibacter algicola]|uniref:Carbon-nitrogen hydrolase family protein n=1 Tax=Ramlibacter algicola TaxID=2795217 RepID=A0A934Q1C1_9BURK|nr:carbon-nitrogen hydrolase family protein [Ramlibacter algicola]MBK0392457.1 carbon-nitrogen hydrolase family protein [Ramlibacter algicola]